MIRGTEELALCRLAFGSPVIVVHLRSVGLWLEYPDTLGFI